MITNLPFDQQKQIVDSLIENAVYTYTFDVTTGIIPEDIIDKHGINYTMEAGLSSPCSFDSIIKRSFQKEYLDVRYAEAELAKELSSAYLLDCYKKGRCYIELCLRIPKFDSFHRLTYFLVKDTESGHIIAHVFSHDITDTEKSKLSHILSVKNRLDDTDSIVASAAIGIWHIYIYDDELPRMSASDKMKELLGIEGRDLSEEDIYRVWHSGIKPSSLPMVENVVKDIITKGFGEVTYKWNHPLRGEIYVRCGGTATAVQGKGYVLRGYHSDVTEIVNAENKHKQLLAEALEEAKHQKDLLQKALDNYKQADYDRRTDFLTRLRNRQDMYDLFSDNLSGVRDKITALFLMDIDNFKMYNDHYGHLAGDECLRKIGAALHAYGEENDLYIYRYGGEEIMAVSFSAKKAPHRIAEEMVKLVADLGMKRDDVPAKTVTVSLGYTCRKTDFDKMIDHADAAMYRAKGNGKNQAVCFDHL